MVMIISALVSLIMVLRSAHANHEFLLKEDEVGWGRLMLEFDSMSMPNEWEPKWPSWAPPDTPWPTPDPGEFFCGNGVIEKDEECDDPSMAIGGVPFQCGPNQFCNDHCQCEFPQGACLSRIGLVFHGHKCEGNPSHDTLCCCNGGPDQGPDNLCNPCDACEKNVAITSQCCRDDGVTDCMEDDVCCPVNAFGRDIKVCLPNSLGDYGEPCNPDLCSPEDLELGLNLCQKQLPCLSQQFMYRIQRLSRK